MASSIEDKLKKKKMKNKISFYFVEFLYDLFMCSLLLF